MPRTNEQRANRAFRALLAYYDMETEEEDAVTDLLTDLRHLSDQYGWSADELAARAQRHYDAEIHEAEIRGDAPGHDEGVL